MRAIDNRPYCWCHNKIKYRSEATLDYALSIMNYALKKQFHEIFVKLFLT